MTLAIGKRAVTFIELLVVIIIIGILASVSLPQFRKAIDRFETENFARNIYYLNHYLQASAIAQGKIHCLNIDQEERTLWGAYREKGQFQELKGRFGKKYKAPEGINILLIPPERTGIYFYPDGSSDEIEITFRSKYAREVTLIKQGAVGEIKIK